MCLEPFVFVVVEAVVVEVDDMDDDVELECCCYFRSGWATISCANIKKLMFARDQWDMHSDEHGSPAGKFLPTCTHTHQNPYP